MSDEMYTYTDPSGDKIKVTATAPANIQVTETFNGKTHRAAVYAPKGADAVELAEAVLAAAGLDDHHILTAERIESGSTMAQAAGLITMRARAADAARAAAVVDRPLNLTEQRAAIVAAIRALPIDYAPEPNDPTCSDAVAMARAILAAAGDTGHEVVSAEAAHEGRLAVMRIAAEAMRDRALRVARDHRDELDGEFRVIENIAALPLLPDDDTTCAPTLAAPAAAFTEANDG